MTSSSRGIFLILACLVLAGALGCSAFDRSRPQTPEECKVTTNPEACRRAFGR
ncbi:MAG: hypothetical protein U0169_08475 [Polyangiaceae bacterium]